MKGTEGTVKRPSYCYYSEVKNLLNLGKMPFSMSSYFDLQELAKICLGFALNTLIMAHAREARTARSDMPPKLKWSE